MIWATAMYIAGSQTPTGPSRSGARWQRHREAGAKADRRDHFVRTPAARSSSFSASRVDDPRAGAGFSLTPRRLRRSRRFSASAWASVIRPARASRRLQTGLANLFAQIVHVHHTLMCLFRGARCWLRLAHRPRKRSRTSGGNRSAQAVVTGRRRNRPQPGGGKSPSARALRGRCRFRACPPEDAHRLNDLQRTSAPEEDRPRRPSSFRR